MAHEARPSPTTRRRPPRFLFRALNPLFTTLLRSPLHRPLSGRPMLLRFSGRRSRKLYTIPVGYAQDDDTLLLGTESRWKQNLRGGARVSVRLVGHERTGTAEVIDDEAGMIEAYRTMVRLAPDYGRAIGIALDSNGELNRGDVAQARQAGHVVIRIRLD